MPKENFKIKINFNLRSKKPTNKPTSINCVIRYKNQRIVISRVDTIKPKFWNAERQLPKYSAENPGAQDLENNLKGPKGISFKIQSAFKEHIEKHNQYPNPVEFREKCKKLIFPEDYTEEKKTDEGHKVFFIKYMDKLIKEIEDGFRVKPKSGLPYAKNTIKNYKTAKRTLEDFAKHLGKEDFKFTEIGVIFYNDLKEYLYSKNHSPNYFGTIIKNIKVFMTEALEDRFHDSREHLSKHFATISMDTDAIYLDTDKLDKLEKLDLSKSPTLDRVRDMFLVGCWSGLRFSDFNNIPADCVLVDTIIVKTKKTGQDVAIPIHDSVKKIINKYEGKTHNSLPPKMSNQKLNKHLKTLGEKAEFKEPVNIKKNKGDKVVTTTVPFHDLMSTHTARRSFATNMYKMGIPVFVIRSITGHKSDKSFFKYIRTTPTEQAEIMREIWNRQQMKAV